MPKRARVDSINDDEVVAEAASTSTRRSTRTKANNGEASTSSKSSKKSKTKKTAAASKSISDGEQIEVPTPRKSKKASSQAVSKVDVDSKSVKDATPHPVTVKPTPSASSSKKPQTYTRQAAEELFDRYRDPERVDVIGVEQFGELCGDADISMETALPLIMCWRLGATELGTFEKKAWLDGTDKARAYTTEGLKLFLQASSDVIVDGKPPGPSSPSKSKAVTKAPYSPDAVLSGYETPIDAFHALYTFAFVLAKPPQSRNLDIDIATAFWAVLLGTRYPLIHRILEFIQEKRPIKAATKDTWSMTLEFCETIKPDLSNVEADSAWPTFLDEFVAWSRDQT